ncbi:DUF4144 domain-containing protein [Shewanella pneumatophori]|uniref:DUF4144 domain-containing protein n=1 Tax=Shewanella pneumatophori TaxID=314092 RepID=A0A9X2CFK4_9GAMM|nr:DUF4144 domain-containing protein [Shewanella pneumatophori]MCL1140027.1 DUF4144 domain-containing protein [Shewanella pneumatophori]
MPTLSLASLQWPIAVKHLQQEELVYLTELAELTEQLPMLGSLDELTIIDSQGYSYQIDNAAAAWQLHLSTPQPSMEQLIEWVRLHASQAGHCCTSKLAANDIQQLFAILEFIEDGEL